MDLSIFNYEITLRCTSVSLSDYVVTPAETIFFAVTQPEKPEHSFGV